MDKDTKKKLPVYELTISDDKKTGVNCISLINKMKKKMTIKRVWCPRCGGVHAKLQAEKFRNICKIGEVIITHFAICPIINQPIMVNLIDEISASLKAETE